MQQNKKNRKARGLMIGLALILVLSVFSGCGKAKTTSADANKAVATYKGGEITQAEFDKFLGVNKVLDQQLASALETPDYKEFIMQQMLTQQAVLEILSGKASDQSKKDGEKKATEYLAPIKDWDKDQKKSFDDKLNQEKLTQKDLENYFKQTFTVMTDMDSKVTDQQVQVQYDNAVKADPHVYEISTVRHILVSVKDPSDPTRQKDLRSKDDALKRAKEVKDKLDKGGDFDALAKEYSDDPGSKDKGGKYENLNLATSGFDPDFTKAANVLEVNKVSDPVDTSFGYHIMKVDSRKTQTLDEKKAEIRNGMGQKLIDEFMQKELPSYEFKSLLPEPSPPAPASPAAPANPANPAPSASASPGAPANPAPSASAPAAASPSVAPSASPGK